MLNKQKQSEARQALQERTLGKVEGKKHVLLKWATGTSKTLMAIKIAEARKAESILLNVKETSHKITWEDEFKKWGFEDLWSKTTCICYASLHTVVGNQYDIVINDECHGLSELREDHLDKIKFDSMISLSATPGEEVEERLENICPYWTSNVPLKRAIELGILPEPTIYIVDVELDDIVIKHTVKGNKTRRTKKYTDKGYYDYLCKQIEKFQAMYEKNYEDWQLHQLNRTGSVRKQFMAHCKTEKAKEILARLEGKRFICFTGSIEQCEELGGKNVIHSGISVNKRKDLIKKLNEKEIDSVFSVNMLKESMNIVEIEAGMMIQTDAKTDRGSVQGLGRCLRGEDPQFYFLRLKDTVDERYVKKAISSLDKQYIKQYEA